MSIFSFVVLLCVCVIKYIVPWPNSEIIFKIKGQDTIYSHSSITSLLYTTLMEACSIAHCLSRRKPSYNKNKKIILFVLKLKITWVRAWLYRIDSSSVVERSPGKWARDQERPPPISPWISTMYSCFGKTRGVSVPFRDESGGREQSLQRRVNYHWKVAILHKSY